jgi:ribonuclease HII
VSKVIVGIDEVGRGPWAGPLVSCAVAFASGLTISGLTDSKRLSKIARQSLRIKIKQNAKCIGIGWVTADEIDILGIAQATRLSMQRAYNQLSVEASEIIIDGSKDYLGHRRSRAEIKADLTYPAVSAASVVAKITRDGYMQQMAKIYPYYGFESHVGYGTEQHKMALNRVGISPIHRLSFAPVKALS